MLTGGHQPRLEVVGELMTICMNVLGLFPNLNSKGVEECLLTQRGNLLLHKAAFEEKLCLVLF